MRKEHLFTLMIVLLPMLQAEWHYWHPLPPVISLGGWSTFCSLCS